MNQPATHFGYSRMAIKRELKRSRVNSSKAVGYPEPSYLSSLLLVRIKELPESLLRSLFCKAIKGKCSIVPRLSLEALHFLSVIKNEK
jgi:hypothetical protein